MQPAACPAAACLVLALAGCHPQSGLTPVAPEDTAPAAPSSPVAEPSSTGAAGGTSPPGGSAASAPSASVPVAQGAAPAESVTPLPGSSGVRCKSTADCAAGYHCARGMPLRGVCWKDGVSEPVCLPASARIATPAGEIAARDVTPGMVVWTTDAKGDRVAAPVKRTSRVAVPPTHRLARVALSDGRELSASPGHPTCSAGGLVGDLGAGDSLDGASVREVELVPYAGGETFDLLPAGATGCYWADGVLIGSTLR